MQNILKFLLKNYLVFLFLLLETLALVIFFQRNDFQRARFLNFFESVAGDYHKRAGNFRSYLNLREVNRQLSEENTRLRNILERAYREEETFFYSVDDTARGQRYFYTPAMVVNNSVNRQRNFITIDKGSLDGVKAEDAIISSRGIAGVVYRVSNRYSSVLSLLNLDFRVSAKLKKNDYFGSLFWDGKDYRYATLSEIPHHVEVAAGDTIVTSGYSAIFPEGVMVGLVDRVSRKGGDFLEIRIRLETDFKNLTHVQVVTNLQKEERINIEKISEGD